MVLFYVFCIPHRSNTYSLPLFVDDYSLFPLLLCGIATVYILCYFTLNYASSVYFVQRLLFQPSEAHSSSKDLNYLMCTMRDVFFLIVVLCYSRGRG